MTLFGASEDNESYLGSSFNLNVAFEPSCLSFLGTTEIINKHIGLLGRVSYCDTYTDDTQNYLTESLMFGSGLIFYSHSIYRDSFFLSFAGNLDRAYVKDIVDDIEGDRFTASVAAGTGYQWQFQKGYIVTLAIYVIYSKPFAYETTADSSLNSEISSSFVKYTPTFLLGWRF